MSAARTMPQLAVTFPACQAQPGELCTSHGGTRVRRYNTRQVRTAAWTAAQAAAAGVSSPGHPTGSGRS